MAYLWHLGPCKTKHQFCFLMAQNDNADENIQDRKKNVETI